MTGASDRQIPVAPVALPASLTEIVAGYRWSRDLVGESGGSVYRLEADDAPALYLKHGTGDVAAAVTDEMSRLAWLAHRAAVPELCGFVALPDAAWLLTTAIPGRTAFQWMEDSPQDRPVIVAALAAHLRSFHALPTDLCPFDSGLPHRMMLARARIDADQVDAEDFGDEHAGWTPLAVWDEMVAELPLAADPVVTHGDYSLDNILIADGRVTGCIDVGRVGVGDRYQDLAILWNCLGEFDEALQAQLFRDYGIADPDRAKLRVFTNLDEFF
ncbi:APH(3') family aminoglycoside O-phosphotransferase [Sphingomonas sp. PB2P19]|uniref:APH(3') family aminoglycoside O-phosphotransferase n=1 Tax=Sphingomonas rhamnosi TaxID=3096156 RepID=UPI002FC86034